MIITGKDLQRLGMSQGKTLGLTKNIAQLLVDSGENKAEVLAQVQAVLNDPTLFVEESVFAPLAHILLAQEKEAAEKAHIPQDDLLDVAIDFGIWGNELIDDNTRQQMSWAMRLPISVAGALMPDAHLGYGLPIGGVLATKNAVIPYAVGVDIACRMMLTIYPETPHILDAQGDRLKKALLNQTHFGIGDKWKTDDRHKPHHAVLDDPEWEAIPYVRSMKDKAAAQLGTSGGGNHFVEWGTMHFDQDDESLGIKAGTYLALLSHSGSRGVGANIANHYTKLAMAAHPNLHPSAKHLAWLDMAHEHGQEYWLAMNLAGRFAQANHHVIHRRVAEAAGLEPILMVENHHNFAWEETMPDGSTAYVHRKGATPAGKGVLGIIPGSMGDAGYLVRGLGNAASLNSASHGAGRQLSRSKATASITAHERNEYLKQHNVTLLSGGLDEAPQAYKPIAEVIAAQTDLVEAIAEFIPKIVRME